MLKNALLVMIAVGSVAFGQEVTGRNGEVEIEAGTLMYQALGWSRDQRTGATTQVGQRVTSSSCKGLQVTNRFNQSVAGVYGCPITCEDGNVYLPVKVGNGIAYTIGVKDENEHWNFHGVCDCDFIEGSDTNIGPKCHSSSSRSTGGSSGSSSGDTIHNGGGFGTGPGGANYLQSK